MQTSFLKWCAVLGSAITLGIASAQAQYTIETLWTIPTGTRDYVTVGSTERGIAINPANGHVLLVSRAGGTQAIILDGDNGSDLGAMDVSLVSGGTFDLNLIAVADDGVIYAANLVSPSADTRPFKLYRWLDESSPVEIVYEGNISDGMRFGDSLDVRGSGTNTLIAVGSGNAVNGVRFAIFTTADGMTFTPTLFSPAGVAAGALQKGITFGPGNTIVGKVNANPARYVTFDLATTNSTLLSSPGIANPISPVSFDSTNNLLAGVDYSGHKLIVYDASDMASPVLISSTAFPTPTTANGNGVGSVDFGLDRLVAIDTQNGVLACRVKKVTVVTPPEITAQPTDVTVLQGGRSTLTTAATGTKPLFFQWFFNDAPLAAQTNASLTLTNIQPSNAGSYFTIITNSAGSVTSLVAKVSVSPLVQSDAMTPLWTLSVGDRPYLVEDNAHRGMAFNPATTNLLVVSRTMGSTNIYVLDALTGADKNMLNALGSDGLNIIVGGTYPINMVGVADDGVVYAANMTTAGSDFTIYRWDNDTAESIPTIAFGPGDPGIGRCGDTLSVRGAGANTQILISSRNGKQVAIFTTADGYYFSPVALTVEDATDGNFGLGVAFGKDDTFWGKSSGQSLRQVGFDLNAGTATTLHNYDYTNFPSAMGPIAVDVTNAWLAAIAIENPDNVRLFNITNLTETPVLIDQELFPTDKDNINGTGALSFGSGLLFALDSNNGIMAFKVKQPTTTPPVAPELSNVKRPANGTFEFTIKGETGRTYVVQATSNFASWQDVLTTNATSASFPVTVDAGTSPRFYRVMVK